MRTGAKHSKIRNTGLLFEFVMRQITADVFEKSTKTVVVLFRAKETGLKPY